MLFRLQILTNKIRVFYISRKILIIIIYLLLSSLLYGQVYYSGGKTIYFQGNDAINWPDSTNIVCKRNQSVIYIADGTFLFNQENIQLSQNKESKKGRNVIKKKNTYIAVAKIEQKSINRGTLYESPKRYITIIPNKTHEYFMGLGFDSDIFSIPPSQYLRFLYIRQSMFQIPSHVYRIHPIIRNVFPFILPKWKRGIGGIRPPPPQLLC